MCPISNIDTTLTHVATLITSNLLNYYYCMRIGVSVSCLVSMYVSVIDSYIPSAEVQQFSNEIYMPG